jgi:hypothetical protein
MPTSFTAFTMRDGIPRRIPDRGTYWHLGKEVKKAITGEGVPWEHPELNKPAPPKTLSKGDQDDSAEYEKLKAEYVAELSDSGQVIPLGPEGKPAVELPGHTKPRPSPNNIP